MIETVLAVLVITGLFLCLFKLSQLLTGKILVEHAAMRVARARAVGFNDFMCQKSARVAVIPIAGKRLWPEGDEFDYPMELARTAVYMQTGNSAIAAGVLDYERWHELRVEPGDGTDARVKLDFEGNAGIESNYPMYMLNGGR